MKENIEEKIFNDTIKEIQAKFGRGSVTTFNEENEIVDAIPTGSIQLNKALGIGGIPRGRIIEVFGNESSGKTTLCLQMVSQCQMLNGKCAYIDLEHALDSNYCTANNVDISKLILAQPDSGEQAFSIIEALIKSDVIDLIIVDSVAALTPQVEIDGTMDDQTIGLQARLMSKGLRILQNVMTKYNKATVVFINQLREKIGVTFGNNETTAGGRALKFYSSVRIELRRTELLKKGDECIGIKTCAKVVKNKLAPPFKKAYIDFYFKNGIDHTYEIIDFALENNIIEKKGSWFYFDNERIAQGRDSTREYLINNHEVFEKIKQKIPI